MTGPGESVIDVALRVAEALESIGAEYFLGGSLASSIDGEPRATNDIDFVVDVPLGRIGDLVSELGSDFEVDLAMLRDAILHGKSANVFYLPLVLKIDIFGHAHGPFDEMEFARRRSVSVQDGRSLYVKSPEDTILRKLLWYREGGEVSDRQWRDVLGVLRAWAGKLDNAYLENWATRLALTTLIERAKEQSLL